MNKRKYFLFVLILVLFSCKTNVFTGKKTLNFVPDSTLFPMAFTQYDQFLRFRNDYPGRSEN
jgi:hypothetical protein